MTRRPPKGTPLIRCAGCKRRFMPLHPGNEKCPACYAPTAEANRKRTTARNKRAQERGK